MVADFVKFYFILHISHLTINILGWSFPILKAILLFLRRRQRKIAQKSNEMNFATWHFVLLTVS